MTKRLLCMFFDQTEIEAYLPWMMKEPGYLPLFGSNVEKANEWVQQYDIACAFIRIHQHWTVPDPTFWNRWPFPVVLVDDEPDLKRAVEWMRMGAEDYVALQEFREFTLDHLHDYLGVHQQTVPMPPVFVGESKKMQEMLALVKQVSQSDSTVLVLGESGTGKELIAKTVHAQSRRKQRPMVAINCAAIPEGLLESELFGHIKGSFTGAYESRKGRFELANKSTLFLDEVGDMSPKLQVKLLRAIQERKIEYVGGGKSLHVDVRLIAATNKDLEKAVQTGAFREDLYYRLNVIPIMVPALRERPEDIPILIQFYLDRFSQINNLEKPSISENVLQSLYEYHWPGNVRELENMMERVVVLFAGKKIEQVATLKKFMRSQEQIVTSIQMSDEGIHLKDVVEDFETGLIRKALQKAGGNKNRAALLLHLNRTTLIEKIKKKHLGVL